MPQLSIENNPCFLCLSGCNACLGIAPLCIACTVAKHNVSFKRDKYTNINIKSKEEAGRCPVNRKNQPTNQKNPGEKMCLVRFSLGTPLDGDLSSINGHR